MTLSEREQIYGTSEAPAASRTLIAGPLAVDLENGQLRYVRFVGVEVLRAISFLARDHYWGTFSAVLDAVVVEETAGRFVVRYQARCAPEAGDLRYAVEIVGEATGRLSFTANGQPLGAFLTNRTGFVVLHPLDGVVGAPVAIDHASGGSETITLPALVSPHEPATDIFAITHQAAPGIRVRVEMTGDAYDMEDQRNWTDASLKTYIRPLTKPKPYVMAAGDRFEQSVTVIVVAAAPTVTAAPSSPTIAVGAQLGIMPPIALGLDGGDIARSNHLIPPGIATLLGRPATPADVAPIAERASAAGAELSLQFAIPAQDPARELFAWGDAAAAAAIFVTPHRLYPLRPTGVAAGNASLEAIAVAARGTFPGAIIGGGVMTGFTEFNRNRPPLEAVDFVTHATSAIVHAADDRSVVESLEALPHVFRSAGALAGGKPYRLGPTGIGLSLNPDGPPRRADPATNARATMIRNDPRQRGLFGAAWTLGYAAAVVAHGVDEYTPAHIAGDFGLFNDDGDLRPIYHVVRALARHRAAVVAAVVGLPNGCRGLAFGGEIWVANLTAASLSLDFGRPTSTTMLDTRSFATAAGDTEFFERPNPPGPARLELQPFAVVKVTL